MKDRAQKYKFILLDTNNLFWRSFLVSSKNFITSKYKNLYSNAIIDALDRVRQIQYQFGYFDAKVYFLMDNPNSAIERRQEINEAYKSHREKKDAPKDFYKILNIFMEIIKSYDDNFYTLWGEGLEADDLTAPVLKSLPVGDGASALVVSADLDWSRNITRYVHWFNWHTVYNRERFLQKFNFKPTPERVKMYKAIVGDPSDNIEKAVPYLPNDVLYDLLDHFESLPEMMKGILQYQNCPEQWRFKIYEAANKLKINYQLVDFLPVKKDIMEFVYPCKRDVKQLRVWFDSLKIPYEDWMLDEDNMAENFFKTQSYRYK